MPFGAGGAMLESLEPRRLMSADAVLDWNQVALEAVRADRTSAGPTWASRNLAIVHAAMYDAVNSIYQTHEPYLLSVKAPKKVSVEAAVAAAAHRMLVELYPAQTDRFDAALHASLAAVPDGPGEAQGVALGAHVARQILRARKDDGSQRQIDYIPGDGLGEWRPTPGDFTPALTPHWGSVKPFTMSAGSDFRPPRPAALDSAEYAAAYDEVKRLGAIDSTERTDEQTQIGIFWGYDRPGMGAPPTMFNQIVRTIAIQQDNTLAQNARLFALANIALADAGIAAWECKYFDNYWRPVTAIRLGDEDPNPATAGDPTWTPLGAPGGGEIPDFTPPFPAYVSGHSTFGAAAFQVLRDFYGTDSMQFTIASDELPGVLRSFDSFSAAAEENGISRIYLGIHWSFDNTEGLALGRSVAQHVYTSVLRPADGRLLMMSIEPAGPPARVEVFVQPHSTIGGALSQLLGTASDPLFA